MQQTRPTIDATPVYRAALMALRSGFAVSAVLIVIALVLAAITRESFHERTGSIGNLGTDLRHGRPTALAELGILAIILTPIATTIAIIISFLRIGDRRYAGISTLVLIVLALSMTIALLR